MSTIKRYRISSLWTEAVVVLDVDHAKLTPELATEINNFWSAPDARIAGADGDVVLAVIKMAAGMFIASVLDPFGDSEYGMQSEFDDSEGWPPHGSHGIKLVEFYGRPEIDSTELKVELLGSNAGGA